MREAFRSTRTEWIHVGVFSTVVNVLMLTGSIYMLQVYDRVLSSRSVPTLIGVTAIALLAFALQGVLDAMRSKMLGRIGACVDEKLAPYAARAATTLPLKGAGPRDSLEPLRDLDALRAFLSSPGPTALIDMPFMPLFVTACFLLHPWLGLLTIASCLLIVMLTLLVERRSKEPNLQLSASHAERAQLAESARRNAEALAGLGMAGLFERRFQAVNARVVQSGLLLSESTGGITATAKVARYVLQSAVLGLGAYLVIRGELSPGAMIAASILTTRALAPVEVAVAHWKQFVAVRQSYGRMKQRLPVLGETEKTLALPAPSMDLSVEDLVVAPPGQQRVVLQGVSFRLKAGDALGIVGPSGSGKSSLARALVGAWPAGRGGVRLDGALIEQWAPEEIGAARGYLPQDVELFEGSIAENIARFRPDFAAEDVLKAANAAGAHNIITAFPEGYDTRLRDGGAGLSGGQRQRIALARALYGDPFLVVLDEPNANLDQQGDDALNQAIMGVRERGGIVVVITHRPTALAGVNLMGVMREGRFADFGPRDQVIEKLMGAPAQGFAPPRRTTAGTVQTRPMGAGYTAAKGTGA